MLGRALPAVLVACAGSSRVPPATPLPPEEPRDAVTAVAILEVAEPTAEELGGPTAVEGLPEPLAQVLARPPQTREQALDTWMLVLRSAAVRRRAGEALGAAPSERDVDATRNGTRITLHVRADGWDGALARCTAIVRAANEETGQGHAAAREWLGNQREQIAAELEAIQTSLEDVPPDLGIDPLEPVEHARAEVDAWRAALPGLSLDSPLPPEDPTTDSLPSLLAGLRAQALELALARSELATRYPDQHPEIRSVDARRARLAERFAAQRDRELAYFDALRRALDASPRSGSARARLAALAETLVAAQGGTGDPVVPSAAPAALRALAQGVFGERQAYAVLGERYGERHPEMVVQRARLDAVTQSLRDEVAREIVRLREAMAALDRARGRTLDRARGRTRAEVLARMIEQTERRLRQAASLGAILRALDRRLRETAAAPPRYRVVGGCERDGS